METIKSLEPFVNRLQKEAAEFLNNSKLALKGIIIQPTEIEVYYYKKGVFEDKSVHRNSLQQNNFSHFYIHRWGVEKQDSYKGGNRAGIDFVISQENNLYHTFLIRSAIIKGKPIVGPNKVLNAIIDECNISKEEIENTIIEICSEKIHYDVVFSQRVNLSKTAEEYQNLPLRAVLCDDNWFLTNKYRYKEQMVIDYLRNKNLSKDQMLEFSKKKLGYIPKIIKQL